jgi:hypothetical protein
VNDNAQHQPLRPVPMYPWYGPTLDELDSDWLALSEVARGLDRDYSTVFRWVKAGRLNAYEEPGSGRLIVNVRDLIVFLHPKPVQVER